MKPIKTLTIYIAIFYSLSGIAWAKVPLAEEPLEFGLFEEMPIVFSASRMAEPITEAPAAISVITAEDLEQWGVVDLPEAFRFTPGVDVTAFNGREWGVTARGFNERLARRMLVVLDGMSVYTPLFSGISWQTLPLIIDDIEKIEVIRGPNDTLYGFNAFNGVINITTKDAADTEGFYGKYTYGSHNRDQFTGRIGDKLDFGDFGKLDVRLSYSFLQSDGFGDNNGEQFEDARHVQLVNGRARYHFNADTNLEYLFGVNYGPQSQGPVAVAGPFAATFERNYYFNHNLFRLNHKFSDSHQAYLQFYRWGFEQDAKSLSAGLNTRDHNEVQYDIEVQDNFSLFDGRSKTVVGASYRHNAVDSLLVRHKFPPRERQTTRDNLFSFFANEKLTLVEDKPLINNLSLSTGVRLEGSQFIPDVEWAPRASILYSPAAAHHFRLTYARAFRLPSFLEEHFTSFTPTGTGTLFQLQGNQDLKREEVNSFEAGYSGHLWDGKLHLDIDTFYAKYDGLVHLVQEQSLIS